MKQLSKNDNQFVFLDPEKVYFIEKFGYLVKKINGGYGDPVQKALFARINNTINSFQTDLPNIVHNLEINRLKTISYKKKVQVLDQISKNDNFKSKSTISTRAAEATRIISKKISVAEKASVHSNVSISDRRIASRENIQPFSNTKATDSNKPIIKSSVIKKERVTTDSLLANQSSITKKKTSSILRPSVAAIREEQRLEQIKAMQQKKALSISAARKQSVKPQPRVLVLTEWERRWHKYDSDLVDLEFNGYANR